jgi:Cu/Ag efflux pump CusA
LNTGTGAEVQKPLSSVLIGGLISRFVLAGQVEQPGAG